MDKNDLKNFNKILDTTFEILGQFNVEALDNEEEARMNARRSLVAANDIPKGKIIEENDLTFKRPAYGISPRYIDEIVGKEAKFDIKEDDIIRKELI